jgi:hypothetical protein
MTVDVLRASSATHEFRPRCLKTEIERLLDERGDVGRGLLVHALVALLHDIDHGRCPRCQGPLRTVEGEVPVGSGVTSCRCIPLCAACGVGETAERSVGGRTSVLDWYGSRAVRHDLERDLEGIDKASRTFVIDLTKVAGRAGDRERVGADRAPLGEEHRPAAFQAGGGRPRPWREAGRSVTGHRTSA